MTKYKNQAKFYLFFNENNVLMLQEDSRSEIRIIIWKNFEIIQE